MDLSFYLAREGKAKKFSFAAQKRLPEFNLPLRTRINVNPPPLLRLALKIKNDILTEFSPTATVIYFKKGENYEPIYCCYFR